MGVAGGVRRGFAITLGNPSADKNGFDHLLTQDDQGSNRARSLGGDLMAARTSDRRVQAFGA